MKVTLLAIGKTSDSNMEAAIETYVRRLRHYTVFELKVIKDVRNAASLSHVELQKAEAEELLKHVGPDDKVVLLDEKGDGMSSRKFAVFLEKQMNTSVKNLVFVIGGAYGFPESMKCGAYTLLSLSDMTFTHQMIRLFFTEQLYRAFTIIRGEKYHND